MKKRIGIVTLPLNTNYGGILQAYALQEVLKRMGYECDTFECNYFPETSILKTIKYFLIKSIKRYLLFQKVDTLFPYHKAKEIYIKNNIEKQLNVRSFVKSYISLLEIRNFKEIPNNYDCLVVGSDQVWRPKYFEENRISHAYLAFAKDWIVRKISYAASFGTDEWEYTEEQTEECKELIQKFDAVSVREASAISMVKDHFQVDSIHVLDPTMLLMKEDYEKLVANANVKQIEGDLFCYVLDEKEDISTFIHQVASQYHLTPFSVGIPDNRKSIFEQIQPPLEQWLRGFMDARLVITDSFHACVFSIIFHKPFIVVGNEERGNARFTSLLLLFGLKNRIVVNGKIPSDALKPLPDSVYEKLEEMQIISIEYLRKHLPD